MRLLASIACLVLLRVTAFGQDTLGVILNEPEDITLLLERHIQFMEELEQIDGYRVQLGSANRLNEANELKEKYERKYEGKEAYIIFSEPTYRVRIGDFLSEVKAYSLMQQVKKYFPEAFVVRDKVYIKAL